MQPEPEVVDGGGRGEALEVGVDLDQAAQPGPGPHRVVDHRGDDIVVILRGQTTADAQPEHSSGQVGQLLDHDSPFGAGAVPVG